MNTFKRGQDIVTGLESLGIRATQDPALGNPPCVLVTPPNLTMDLQCLAVTAEWQLVALAPAINTADHTTWQELETLVVAAMQIVDVQTADVVTYVLNGRTYPAYILSFSEGVN